jgi:hypothetical protein
MLLNAVNRANVGMVEGRGGARILQKALQRDVALRCLGGQKLEGYVTAEHGVFGFVHDTHTAAAQL